ncbi:MAG: hypothetical protein Aureis2KO_01420 [Aureisphaera sp.]
MKKIFVLASLIVGVPSLFGQDQANYPEQFSKMVQVPPSPEAAAFQKYGDYEVSLHTGTPNISVPLYVYKGREMDLPISLTYDASGIKVNQASTNVGLGWNLNVGGRVTRQTRGLPDHGVATLGPKNATIRNKVVKYRDYNGFYDDTGNIFDNSSVAAAKDDVQEYYEFLEDVSKSEIDIEQDYFSVNGMGLNDIIWMDTQNYTPHPLKDINLKIVSPVSPTGWDINHWEFIDGSGNRYFFGNYFDGSEPYDIATNPTNAIEIIQRKDDKDTQPIPNSNITYNSSWLLAKVVSANGKDVYHFNYTNNTEADFPELPSVINQTTTHNKDHMGGGVFQYTGAGSLPQSNKISSVKSYNTLQVLESVYHNGREVIRFEVMDRNDLQNGTDKGVKAIRVYEDYASSTVPLQKIELEHTYFESGSATEYYQKRLKLDSIKIGTGTDLKRYGFDYDNPTSLPDRFSYDFDILGYFNGAGNSTAFQKWPSTGTVELPGGDRTVSEQHTKYGTLNKISYPTGGYTEFEYENHKTATETLPGLRIKSISSYADTGVLATKNAYEYPDSALHKSFAPILFIEEELELSPCISNSFGVTPGTLYRYVMPPNMDDGAYINYDKVIQRRVDGTTDHGYTEFDFVTGTGNENWVNNNQMPFYNYYTSGQGIGNPKGSKVVNDQNATLTSEVNTYSSSADIYLDQTFVVKQNPLKNYSYICVSKNGSTINVFSGDGNVQPDTSSCPTLVTWQIESQGHESMAAGYCTGPDSEGINISTLAKFEQRPVSIQAKSSHLITAVKTEYFGGQSVTTTTNNTYTIDTHLMASTESDIGDGDRLRTEYTYPLDIPLGIRTVAEDSLIDANRLSAPIMTKTKRVDDQNNATLLATQKTIYKKWTIDSVKHLQPEFVRSEKGGTGSSLEDRIEVIALDPHGNIREASLTDGPSVTYLWGYDGRYPVAKIEDRSYASLNSALLVAVEGASEANMATALQNLRNHVDTTGGLMTSYTYLPMVGVSTVTDPRGYTMYYHYDEHHRLKYVKDPDGNVLSENEYVYRTNNP